MAFEENLKKCGCVIKRDCRLKSSFGDEFTVKTAVFPSDFTAAAKAAKACRGAVYLGGITNTLVLGDIDIAVCMRGMKGIIDGERDLYVMAGESLSSVCRWARMRGLSGMEQLCGIPGTVGGAAAGNSGCYGREISDVLVYADVAAGGRIERLYAGDIDFSYRRSSLKGAGLILGVMLRLTPSDGNKIEEDISILESRRNRIYDNLNAIPVHYRKTEIIRYIYHAVSTSDYTIKEAIDLYDRNEQRKIDEARLREQQIYNQLQEEANAYADEMNDLQREANETAAKARRDMNIANAANIYQNHKKNKMLDRMNKK